VVLTGAGAVRVGLVVVSDRASSGHYEDKSGPAMAHILTGTSTLDINIYDTCVY
jgi:molybdopterin biosynthesis enzyme MoaB